MPVLNFPSNPFSGQIYVENSRSWIWDTVSWNPLTFPLSQGLSGPLGSQGSQGSIGNIGSQGSKAFESGLTPTQEDIIFFGNGEDGNHTINSTDATIGTWIVNGVIQRDVFFNNLTMSAGGQINTNGWRIYIKGVLDITNASADAIRAAVPTVGGDAINQNAGSGGLAFHAAQTLGASTAGGLGATGVVGAAAESAAVTNTSCLGGRGGARGWLGGGTAVVGAPPTFKMNTWYRDAIKTGILFNAGGGGKGGASGAGDGVVAGGGGGGGGAGGGWVYICARSINRGPGTAAGCISAVGGNAGNGASRTTGAVGGGSGGGGGGGGIVHIFYDTLLGTTAINAINTSGGLGGGGGNGTFVGASGGGGGQGGYGGWIMIYSLTLGATIYSDQTANPGDQPPAITGQSGEAGGPGYVHFINL